MKIHELAQKTGLTAPTIRFYEQEGLLDTRYMRREANNYHNYRNVQPSLVRDRTEPGYTASPPICA